MPSRKIEQQLDSLNALRAAGVSEQAAAQLRKALNDRVNVVIAKGAQVAAALGMSHLIPDLAAAFERLLSKGAEADPQCWGKNALVKALKELGHDQADLFLRGLQCVQMEASWGPAVDTAGTLRSVCVLALLQCVDLPRDAKLWHQMCALTDAEAVVRLEAVRAIEEMDGTEAALLLGLKARTGDLEAGVTGQALSSLLAVERGRALPFVLKFLDSREEGIQAEAALALGASREPAAIEALIAYWRDFTIGSSGAILRGISASRQDVALDFLVTLVREGRERDALAALEALELHRDSVELCARVRDAVAARPEKALRERVGQSFSAGS